jgi:hypothetical protein
MAFILLHLVTDPLDICRNSVEALAAVGRTDHIGFGRPHTDEGCKRRIQ